MLSRPIGDVFSDFVEYIEVIYLEDGKKKFQGLSILSKYIKIKAHLP